MGCWNGTCGISQLPIRQGDPVVGFLLEQQATAPDLGGGQCYSTGLWAPLFVPIIGEYNDYGSMENIEEGAEALVAFFNTEKTITLTSRHEGDAAPKNPAEIEAMIDFVERGQYRFNWSSTYGKGSIGLMMIHKDVFDAAVQEYGDRIPYSQDKTYRELLVERTTKQINSFLDDDAADGAAGDDAAIMRKFLKKMKVRFFEHEAGFYNKFLFDQIIEDHTLDRAKLVDLLVNYSLITGVMECMRKSWMPQSGAGSQSCEYALHKAVFSAVTKVVEKDATRYEEFDEETPEEIWTAESIYWYDREEY